MKVIERAQSAIRSVSDWADAKVATVVGIGFAAASSAHASIDVTAATTGVSDAQTAVLAVLAAMVTMAAAIYGVKKVLRLLGR